MVIAAIGKTDFPQRWPSLLNDLVNCLGSPQKVREREREREKKKIILFEKNLVHGGIKCLDMLATSEVRKRRKERKDLIFFKDGR